MDASPTGLSTDQRDVARPQDGNGDSTASYDIGAFELGASDAKVCKYTGGGEVGWDCDRTDSNASTVWRDGILGGFSDWAVGERVGPTAVTLQSLSTQTPPTQTGFVAVVLAGVTAVTLALKLFTAVVDSARQAQPAMLQRKH
ncbi:MAG: hypothetical protein GY796_24740 [Chloroflexi bacterium]|nr:hypothetical protein [Chloroflexota bacterium]